MQFIQAKGRADGMVAFPIQAGPSRIVNKGPAA